jgi:hypothetical protein
VSIESHSQDTETAEILLQRIMTLADLLVRRSDEEPVEPPDESPETSENTQESKPDVD